MVMQDVMSQTYQIPCPYQFEDNGTDIDVENVRKY